MVLKRFRPRARGRSGKILKPFSKIRILVQEKEKEKEKVKEKAKEIKSTKEINKSLEENNNGTKN